MSRGKDFVIAGILALLLVLFVPILCAQAETQSAQVMGTDVNMRSQPNTESSIVEKLTTGTTVEVVEEIDSDWSRVIFSGKTGYIKNDLLFFRTVKGRLARANKDGVNLRGGPATSAYIVAKTEVGTSMKVLQMVEDWYFVEYGDVQGFVQKDLVELTDQEWSEQGGTLLHPGMEGDLVVQVQTELVRRNFMEKTSIDGKYGATTRSAVLDFQKAASLDADGTVGTVTLETLFDPNNTTKKAPKVPQTSNDFYNKVITAEWWKGGSSILKRPGGTARLYDVASGRSFNIIRTGGTNHIDGAPLTAKDTAIMKSIYGGSWNHDRRGVIMIVGNRYYAASLYGMPHGRDVQKNDNYPGMLCVHLSNSKTHGGGRVDPGHQGQINAIMRKYGKKSSS